MMDTEITEVSGRVKLPLTWNTNTALAGIILASLATLYVMRSSLGGSGAIQP